MISLKNLVRATFVTAVMGLCLVSGYVEKANDLARHARRSLETEQADLTEVDYLLAAELARLSLALRQPEQASQASRFPSGFGDPHLAPGGQSADAGKRCKDRNRARSRG